MANFKSAHLLPFASTRLLGETTPSGGNRHANGQAASGPGLGEGVSPVLLAWYALGISRGGAAPSGNQADYGNAERIAKFRGRSDVERGRCARNRAT
eukprot:7990353-Pyramimonas_sp.AAC.1